MTTLLIPHDHSNIERIAQQQLDKILKELSDPAGKDIVHDTRTYCKKMRAMLRLVHDDVPHPVYERENGRFRDIARPLTRLRDAQVHIKTFEALRRRFPGEMPKDIFNHIHDWLQWENRQVQNRLLASEHVLEDMPRRLQEMRYRLREWAVAKEYWAEIEHGIRRCYRKGRDAFATAASLPNVDNLHAWRKQAKYLWYQLTLLEPSRPRKLKKLSDRFWRLTQRLGDDHDIAMLRRSLMEHFDPHMLADILPLIGRRRTELRYKAFRLGNKLYRKRPKRFTRGLEQAL